MKSAWIPFKKLAMLAHLYGKPLPSLQVSPERLASITDSNARRIFRFLEREKDGKEMKRDEKGVSFWFAPRRFAVGAGATPAERASSLSISF